MVWHNALSRAGHDVIAQGGKDGTKARLFQGEPQRPSAIGSRADFDSQRPHRLHGWRLGLREDQQPDGVRRHEVGIDVMRVPGVDACLGRYPACRQLVP